MCCHEKMLSKKQVTELYMSGVIPLVLKILYCVEKKLLGVSLWRMRSREILLYAFINLVCCEHMYFTS